MKRLIIFLAVMLMVDLLSAQYVMTFQPNGGLNDGSDSGTVNGGKDAWVNRYSPNDNNGTSMYNISSPRSNCNTSDYKAYLQFDLATLPDSSAVDSVFFGVTHYSHTNYCYSNCNADFYFYYVTSPWDEMTIIESNQPTEDATPFYGPINITFPNDFQNREYNITNAYYHWKTNPAVNYGFAIYSPTVGCNNAAVVFNIHSSDDTDATTRPYLKIYYHDTVNAVNDIRNNPSFIAYPNPFKNELKINIGHPDKYYFRDLLGRKYPVPYNDKNNSFNTTDLNPGLYILFIEKNKTTSIFKVFKQ